MTVCDVAVAYFTSETCDKNRPSKCTAVSRLWVTVIDHYGGWSRTFYLPGFLSDFLTQCFAVDLYSKH